MPVDPQSAKNLKFHHTGLLVKDMDAAVIYYGKIFGKDAISGIFDIKTQSVKVCFIENGSGSFLELVQPAEGNNKFDALFKRGIQYYHIAFTTNKFDMELQSLTNDGFRLIEIFNSEAFNGKRCAFLYSGQMHLFELIEE
ncbi:VOC family protein [Flavobacterium pallidum]|uniref:VOC domain-containing protein n=1 Tax=Flavobacterium pallidum TaxID=2172098 RepID=A0A2S1SGZ5_9FLAO|nr:VOC family protein [Flavobacterium pallidum]AWI25670.1 hypothetical protein HYN49_07025 [Flavobacterium pallidum]